MPLILDPKGHSAGTLSELLNEFTQTLAELRAGLPDPSPHVRDPASIETARELIDAALGRMKDAHAGSREEVAAAVNLGYATMVAVIDLVKSHTDRPRVPARSTRPDDRAEADRLLTRPRRPSRAG
jgi:hypothetical protein